MELEGERRTAVLERLIAERVAFRQQHGVRGQIETLAMPLIDVIGPLKELLARLRRPQRIVADLDQALRMKIDLGAERARENLRAEANAEERLLLAQRHFRPLDFLLHIVVVIVGAHRPAKDRNARVLLERLRQRIAATRAADVERKPALGEQPADAAGRRVFLVEDDQDRLGH